MDGKTGRRCAKSRPWGSWSVELWRWPKKGGGGRCFSYVANMNTLPPSNVDILASKDTVVVQEAEKPLSLLLLHRTHPGELLIQQSVNGDLGWGIKGEGQPKQDSIMG